jgi:hypothetical protein
MTPRARSILAWAGGIAFVVAAWGVAFVTPDSEAASAPFVVRAGIDERAEGRNIALTVTDARIADGVAAGSGWSAEGTWVVIDLDAEAVISETGAGLSYAVLEVDGREYSASERPPSMLRARLAVGVSTSGTIAFEVPAAVATARDALLRLGVNSTPDLDSVIEIPLALSDLPRSAAIEWEPTRWTEQ